MPNLVGVSLMSDDMKVSLRLKIMIILEPRSFMLGDVAMWVIGTIPNLVVVSEMV